MIKSRFVLLKGAGITIRAPPGLRACAAITLSIASFASTAVARISTPSDAAA
jgi:hypothetical protein